ncbi:GntR family transcriptional regulator [Microbulbifer sp. CAU 1566]|uniref:GntR family transcriptional regulator n=1 Tax=Microbulbifer sp. CAU 1566 TaxID=2933269 RepID=UPI002005177F|nr:GntR family transcriptional regulator [Microbulbifer sp. CAU 1566]MCK7596091.1 GntR family transcriptional regulator [Microbulbifer sp. CAU 1566]
MSKSWQQEVLAEVKAGGRVTDQQIVDKIRKAVLTQRLPPNTRLPEVALGEIFGVSRSVIRKALTRLDADHVITQAPNQVARVRAPSIEETRETFAARRLVEGEVCSLLAGNMKPVQLKALEKLVQAESDAHADGDEPSRIEHSLAIHHMVADLSPNRVLGNFLTDLILRTSIVIALYKREGLASCYLKGDHTRLLKNLRSGDGEGACKAIVDHLNSLEKLMDLSSRDSSIDLMAILGQRVG